MRDHDTRRCQGTTDEGRPCGAPSALVNPETGYCGAHGPGATERMRLAGKKGAEASKASRQPHGMEAGELPPLAGHAEAKLWLERIGRAVATGRLKTRPAQAAIRAVSEWVKAHEGEMAAELFDDLKADVERLKRTLEDGSPGPRLLEEGGK